MAASSSAKHDRGITLALGASQMATELPLSMQTRQMMNQSASQLVLSLSVLCIPPPAPLSTPGLRLPSVFLPQVLLILLARHHGRDRQDQSLGHHHWRGRHHRHLHLHIHDRQHHPYGCLCRCCLCRRCCPSQVCQTPGTGFKQWATQGTRIGFPSPLESIPQALLGLILLTTYYHKK